MLIIDIWGKVQGVFFRASAKRKADALGVSGFAQNMPDGSVHIEASGRQEDLDAFLAWCHEGPEKAEVRRVEVEVSYGGSGSKIFEIR